MQLVNVPEGETVQITARLRPSAILLDSLVVSVRPRRSRLEEVGFIGRERRGFGHFFTGEAAEAWRIERTVGMVPRVRLQPISAVRNARVDAARGTTVHSGNLS
jgi:hypothetical protein